MTEECKCGGHIFLDRMCEPCLKVLEKEIEGKIEALEEKVSDLESTLDELQHYLYVEPYSERADQG